MHKILFTSLALVVCSTLSCSPAPVAGEDVQVTAPDAGPPDASVPDASPPDADIPDALCVPTTCAESGECGDVDDGCGNVLSCIENCECETIDDCPERPCETLSACEDNACEYEAVQCGGESCECATGDCSDADLRSCGEGVCTPEFCDPRFDGESYENVCVTEVNSTCGVCELGAQFCDADTDTFVCDDIELGNIDPLFAVCDSTSSNSTFVFVDADYAEDDGDGSRARPFAEIVAALDAAEAKNAEGVIIAGSPTFTQALIVRNGVSVRGGYNPNFERDADARPVFDIPAAAVEQPESGDQRLLGMSAREISVPTIVEHIEVRTASLPPSPVHNYAVHVENAPALSLIDVTATAGNAGAGTGFGIAARGAGRGFPPAIQNGFGDALNGGSSILGVVSNCNITPGLRTERSPQPPVQQCEDGPTLRGGLGGFGVGGFAGREGQDGEGSPGSGGTALDIGRTGAAGAPGIDGANGIAGGTVFQGFFTANSAATSGTLGGRSGGGGGGFGGQFRSVGVPNCQVGSSGGNGGHGACGGPGGQGATSAGSSFGLFVVNSTGIRVVGGRYNAGNAGNGGGGAQGGSGGLGGIGGASTGTGDSLGYRGGEGGRAGQGGAGGASPGGDSYGVYCSLTTVDLSETEFNAGAAGTGGLQAEGQPNLPNAPAGTSAAQLGCE